MKLRYLLVKSKQLILINIFISVIVMLCFTNLAEAYNMAKLNSNYLSDDYISFSITDNEGNDGSRVGLGDLLSSLNECCSGYYLHKNSAAGIVGIYSDSLDFVPDLVSGRGLKSEDFVTHTNTILVCEDILKDCYLDKGVYHYIYNNQIFEVVGVYRKSNNKVNIDADAYYNLNAGNVINEMNYVVDIYSFDSVSGESCEAALKNMKYIIHDKAVSVAERAEKAISSQEASLLSIALVTVMVLINSINISANWIDGRRKEICVRRMVGATNRQIKRRLFVDYMTVLTLAFLPAILISYVLTAVDLKIFIGFDFSVYTVFLTYIIVFLIGILTNWIMLLQYNSGNISKVMRW